MFVYILFVQMPMETKRWQKIYFLKFKGTAVYDPSEINTMNQSSVLWKNSKND